MSYQKNKQTEARDFSVSYGKIQFSVFDSFEEESDYVAKQRAETPYEKRLTDMDQLRKRVFSNQLLPDKSWKPVPRIFKIMPSHTDDDGE